LFKHFKMLVSFLRAFLGLTKNEAIASASKIYALKGILEANGILIARRGSVAAGVNKGVALIVEIILLSLAGQFVAAFVPSTLTAIATTALTSVNGAVQTIFQTGLSLTLVGTIILLFIGVIAETFRSL
jgi:hypothetical protein